MTVPSIRTAYGLRLAAEPRPFTMPDLTSAMLTAARVDQEADAEMQLGHHLAADRLAHLALELRARAGGVDGIRQSGRA